MVLPAGRGQGHQLPHLAGPVPSTCLAETEEYSFLRSLGSSSPACLQVITGEQCPEGAWCVSLEDSDPGNWFSAQPSPVRLPFALKVSFLLCVHTPQLRKWFFRQDQKNARGGFRLGGQRCGGWFRPCPVHTVSSGNHRGPPGRRQLEPTPPHLPVLSRLCPWAVQDGRGKCREYVLCSPKCPRHASRVTG